MALTLANTPWNKGGTPPVSNDQEKDKSGSTSAYVIESIEYVGTTLLPANALFDDPDELDRMLSYTKKSIESRTQSLPGPPEGT
jgi:hypothetical protein